jgi:hypothetical protein
MIRYYVGRLLLSLKVLVKDFNVWVAGIVFVYSLINAIT